MRKRRLAYAAALFAVAALLLVVAPRAGRADDVTKNFAQFKDGMRNRDYPKAMQGFLAELGVFDGIEKHSPAAGETACFDALKTGDAAHASAACSDFAKRSGGDPRAYTGLALADLIDGRMLDAVAALDDALGRAPGDQMANMLRAYLADGGFGAIGGGWAEPVAGSGVDLKTALARFAAGDFAGAAAAFETIFNAGQVQGNIPLILYIARRRAGIFTAGVELDAMRDLGGPRYQMLIASLRGEAAPRDALRWYLTTGEHEDNNYAADHFFLGEAALLANDHTEAKRYFERAATGPKESIEVGLAKAELARLP